MTRTAQTPAAAIPMRASADTKLNPIAPQSRRLGSGSRETCDATSRLLGRIPPGAAAESPDVLRDADALGVERCELPHLEMCQSWPSPKERRETLVPEESLTSEFI